MLFLTGTLVMSSTLCCSWLKLRSWFKISSRNEFIALLTVAFWDTSVCDNFRYLIRVLVLSTKRNITHGGLFVMLGYYWGRLARFYYVKWPLSWNLIFVLSGFAEPGFFEENIQYVLLQNIIEYLSLKIYVPHGLKLFLNVFPRAIFKEWHIICINLIINRYHNCR